MQSPVNAVSDERGAATIVAAICLVLMVSLTVGASYVGAAVVARHRAQAAADLAALTGANRVAAGPSSACGQATEVAQRMGARVADCVVDGLDVTVRVEIVVRLGRFDAGPARAAARAGPADHVASPATLSSPSVGRRIVISPAKVSLSSSTRLTLTCKGTH